jgi:hypothetical protein
MMISRLYMKEIISVRERGEEVDYFAVAHFVDLSLSLPLTDRPRLRGTNTPPQNLTGRLIKRGAA